MSTGYRCVRAYRAALFFATLLVLAIGDTERWLARALPNAALARVGLYSYGMYVLHWPLLMLMAVTGTLQKLTGTWGLFGAIVYFVLAC